MGLCNAELDFFVAAFIVYWSWQWPRRCWWCEVRNYQLMFLTVRVPGMVS